MGESVGHEGNHQSISGDPTDFSDVKQKHLYFSYSWRVRKSKEDVQALATYMRDRHGFTNIHIDIFDMIDDFGEWMAEKISESTVVLVFISQDYADSQNCMKEIRFAAEKKKLILPIVVQERFYPHDELAFLIGQRLWLEYFGSDDDKKKVVEHLAKLIRAPPKPVTLTKSKKKHIFISYPSITRFLRKNDPVNKFVHDITTALGLTFEIQHRLAFDDDVSASVQYDDIVKQQISEANCFVAIYENKDFIGDENCKKDIAILQDYPKIPILIVNTSENFQPRSWFKVFLKGLEKQAILQVDMQQKNPDDDDLDDFITENLLEALKSMIDGRGLMEKPIADTPERMKKKQMTTLFISYSWNQRADEVRRLATFLQNKGFKDVIIDVEGIRGVTDQWMTNAINQSDVVVACISDEYANSDNCMKEWAFANRMRKIIVPVVVQAGYRPQGRLQMELNGRLWVNYLDDDENNDAVKVYNQIIKVLD